MKSSIVSTLLLICIISITVSFFVPFTQAEGLQARYSLRAENSTSTGSLTGGKSNSTGVSGTTSSTSGAGASGNSTQGNSTTSGSLTSGGSFGSTTGVATTTSATTSTSTFTVTVVVTFQFRCVIDPTTYNYTRARLTYITKLGTDRINITYIPVAASKRAVEAAGNYLVNVTITTPKTSTLGQLSQEGWATLANSTGREALTEAGATVTGVSVSIVEVTTLNPSAAPTLAPAAVGLSTTGTPDASTGGGLSAGAIAGIVIGIVALVVIVVAAVIISKKRSKKHSQVQPLLNNGNGNGPHYP